MPWVRLDDEFPDHPKVVQAGPLAGWLHVCALAYCNRFLTDGFIPLAQVAKLSDFSGIGEFTPGALAAAGHDADAFVLAERLVDHGMWEQTEGGYLIHNYLNYQPSRAEVEAQRKQRAEAGRRGGLARGKQTASEVPSEPLSNGSSQTEAKSNPVPGPVPLNSSSSPSYSTAHSPEEEDEIRKEAQRRLRNRKGDALVDTSAWLRKTEAGIREELRERRVKEAERQRILSCVRCAGKGNWLDGDGMAHVCDHKLEETA